MLIRRSVIPSLLGGALFYLTLNWMMLSKVISAVAAGNVVKTIGGTVLLSVGFLSMIFGALATHRIVRSVLIIAMACSAASNYSYYYINGGIPWRATAIWLFSEAGQFNDLIMQWAYVIVGSFILAATLISGLSIFSGSANRWLVARAPRHIYRTLKFLAMFVFFSIPITGALSAAKFGLVETNTLAFWLVSISMDSPEVENMDNLINRGSEFKKVVLIVDESVRPDAFNQAVSNMLPSGALNYGVALSTANCSAPSNILLRLGVNPANIGRYHDPRSQLSVFEFAKRAGFDTTLIDGQLSDPSKRQNFLSIRERESIDEYIAADVGLNTDLELANLLKVRLRSPAKEFIYVIKKGSHFPYESRIPKDLVNNGMRTPELYLTSVMYSTGRFFEELMSSITSLDGIFISYTSDHGQYWGEGSTHCRNDHPLDEYLVPLVIMSGPSIIGSSLLRSKSCWDGKADHQVLRTTILESLGYGANDLKAHFFPSMTACDVPTSIPRLKSFPFPTARGEVVEYEMMPR